MISTAKRHLLKGCAALAFGCVGLLGAKAEAQTCGGTYVVKSGDTLSVIANRLYADAGKWAPIYQANTAVIGNSPDRIRVGQKLSMPCIAGLPTGLEGGVNQAEFVKATPLVVPAGDPNMKRKINIVTGDDGLPWSDRSLPQGGMMTELVDAAMTAADPEGGFAIHWVNDWSAHFEPLMSNALLDAGFPWYRPDCAAQPDTYRCQNLSFSEPVFEVLVMLYVRNDSNLMFDHDDDVIGKTLCRPKGFATFFLDQDGRNWLKEDKIQLETPLRSEECFEMLAAGTVDAVVINEFHGRKAIAKLGLKDQVMVAPGQPLAVQGLHVVVHKAHPDADAILAMVADGIEKIRKDGSHQEIVSGHLNRIWSNY